VVATLIKFPHVLLFESLALGYFMVLAAAAWTSRGGRGRVWRAAAASLLMASIVALAAARLPMTVRAWLGHLYLATGYWIPALAARGGHYGRFERWLVSADAAWQHRLVLVPRWLAHIGELAYLLCYPFVPAAFASIWLAGTVADIDRFWVAVLIAGFSCYVSLPWLAARPPRLLPPDGPAQETVARLNAAILARVSHGLITFPSGHVAVSAAAALSLLPVSPLLGLVFTCIAAGIALGAATGRYHYVVDVMTGIAVGLLAPLAATLALGPTALPHAAT